VRKAHPDTRTRSVINPLSEEEEEEEEESKQKKRTISSVKL
jgi:hypothetical protein